MEEYNMMHYKDSERNYFVINEDLTPEILQQRSIIAKKIYQNYDSLSNDEIVKMANACTNIKKYRSQLLAFELRYYEDAPAKHMSLDEFTIKAQAIFERYQSKAGGQRIEDLDWKLYTKDDDEPGRIVMGNELLFENSMCKCDEEDSDTTRYLNQIVKRLNSLAENISIDLRFNHEKNIIWVWLWCTDESSAVKAPEIGL